MFTLRISATMVARFFQQFPSPIADDNGISHECHR